MSRQAPVQQEFAPEATTALGVSFPPGRVHGTWERVVMMFHIPLITLVLLRRLDESYDLLDAPRKRMHRIAQGEYIGRLRASNILRKR